MSEQIESGEFNPDEQGYVRWTDEEVNGFAKALYRNEVFVSWQIHKCDEHLLSSIFMPLIFIDEITRKTLLRDKVAHFWAYMKDAGPRSINGYPMFTSMGMLNQEDAERVDKRLTEIRELLGDD